METSNSKSRVKLVSYPQVLLQIYISCLPAQNWRQTYGMALNKATSRSPAKPVLPFQGHPWTEPFASVVSSWVTARRVTLPERSWDKTLSFFCLGLFLRISLRTWRPWLTEFTVTVFYSAIKAFKMYFRGFLFSQQHSKYNERKNYPCRCCGVSNNNKISARHRTKIASGILIHSI